MLFGVRDPLFDNLRALRLLDEMARGQAGRPLADGHFTEGPGFVQEGDRFVLRVEVAGLRSDDLELSVHERTLTLRARRREEAPEGFRILRRERGVEYNVAQTVALPSQADPDQCTASLADGLLTVSFATRSHTGPRRIDIGAVEGRTA
jgi:HSP20 family protein